MAHTPGPWREGEWGGSVVADHPVEGMEMPIFHDIEETSKVYGGYLIAESIVPCNKPLIIAAPEMYEALKKILEVYEPDEAVVPVRKILRKAEGRGEK